MTNITTAPYCKDCLHFMSDRYGWWCGRHTTEVDSISKPGTKFKVGWVFCQAERQRQSLTEVLVAQDKCGPKGKYFLPKEK